MYPFEKEVVSILVFVQNGFLFFSLRLFCYYFIPTSLKKEKSQILHHRGGTFSNPFSSAEMVLTIPNDF